MSDTEARTTEVTEAEETAAEVTTDVEDSATEKNTQTENLSGDAVDNKQLANLAQDADSVVKSICRTTIEKLLEMIKQDYGSDKKLLDLLPGIGDHLETLARAIITKDAYAKLYQMFSKFEQESSGNIKVSEKIAGLYNRLDTNFLQHLMSYSEGVIVDRTESEGHAFPVLEDRKGEYVPNSSQDMSGFLDEVTSNDAQPLPEAGQSENAEGETSTHTGVVRPENIEGDPRSSSEAQQPGNVEDGSHVSPVSQVSEHPQSCLTVEGLPAQDGMTIMHPRSSPLAADCSETIIHRDVPEGTRGLLELYHGIYKEIKRILNNGSVGRHLITPDPREPHKLYIVGVNVPPTVTNQLQAITCAEAFRRFSIYTSKAEVEPNNGLPRYYTLLMYGTLQKQKLVDFDDETEAIKSDKKCELIVTGDYLPAYIGPTTNTGNDLRTGYYGVTVAHAFLNSVQLVSLSNTSDPEKPVREQMLTVNWNYQWWINSKSFGISRAPLTKSRQWFENEEEFLQDVAVFGVVEQDLRNQLLIGDHEAKLRTLECNHTSYIIGGIWPISSREQLNQLRGKKVFVAGREGTLGGPPFATDDDGLHLGVHTTFSFNDKYGLAPGNSGSMVYVVDMEERYVYIVGMLFGVNTCVERDHGVSIYSVIVLHPVLAKIEDDISKVQDLRAIWDGLGPAYNRPDRLQDGL